MASFPSYTVVHGTKFQIHYNITITLTFWQLYSHIQSSHIGQNLSNLNLKLLTNSADTRLSDKLLHIGTTLCEKFLRRYSYLHPSDTNVYILPLASTANDDPLQQCD